MSYLLIDSVKNLISCSKQKLTSSVTDIEKFKSFISALIGSTNLITLTNLFSVAWVIGSKGFSIDEKVIEYLLHNLQPLS